MLEPSALTAGTDAFLWAIMFPESGNQLGFMRFGSPGLGADGVDEGVLVGWNPSLPSDCVCSRWDGGEGRGCCCILWSFRFFKGFTS